MPPLRSGRARPPSPQDRKHTPSSDAPFGRAVIVWSVLHTPLQQGCASRGILRARTRWGPFRAPAASRPPQPLHVPHRAGPQNARYARLLFLRRAARTGPAPFLRLAARAPQKASGKNAPTSALRSAPRRFAAAPLHYGPSGTAPVGAFLSRWPAGAFAIAP